MKKHFFLLILFFSTAAGIRAQQSPAAVAEALGITQVYDFGNIRQGRPVNTEISFRNNGKEALKIENISASCGCTTPRWSKEPVAPGQLSFITVGYNAATEGSFEKTVTIFYNGGKTKTVLIKGNVTKPLPPAPVNSSVQLLNQ